jgi:hypothetical protein
MISAAIIIAVALGLAVLAGAFYLREPRGKSAGIFLWIIRSLALLMLLCAFFQPALTFKTLSRNDGGAAVLIDASRSMGLFGLDSLLRRLSGLKDYPGAPSSGRQRVQFFSFGDSLRPCAAASLPAIGFSDNHSFFPKALSSWPTVIIVSDGNWSNSSLPADIFEDKNCYYLALPPPSPRPFLHSSVISFQPVAVKDSALAAILAVQGYKTTERPIEIDVRQGAKQLLHRERRLPAGYFNDTISLPLPTDEAGRFLYHIGVRNAADSLRSHAYLKENIVPSAFSAAVAASSPSIDARFLSLALSSDPAWRIDGGENAAASADALLLLDWSASAQKAFSALKPSGVAVFVGCLPCEKPAMIAPDTFGLFSTGPDDSLTQRILERTLPSPGRIVTCDRMPFSGERTTIECIVRKKNPLRKAAPGGAGDTLPLLFEGVYKGRSCVALTACDLWHMEFLPLGLTQETEGGSFLRDVFSIVKRSVANRRNRSFFVYPREQGISEFDSGSFCIVLPPEMTAARQAGGSPEGRIAFSIGQNGRGVFDTAFAAGVETTEGTSVVRCPPLPAGVYTYGAALTLNNKRFSWIDTMVVMKSDLELSIQGQNTVLLNQLALPLDINDPRALEAVFTRRDGPSNGVFSETVVRLKRSWWLWGIIVALFCLEWAVRKKVGLDA